MNEKKVCYWKTIVNLAFSVLATFIVIYVGVKSIFFFMPFVIGWLIAIVASPIVKLLEKRLKIIKKLSSAGIIIFVLALIILLVYLLISTLWDVGMDIFENAPTYYESLEVELQQATRSLQLIEERLPENIQATMDAVTGNLSIYLGDILSAMSEPTVSAAGSVAMKIPSVLISFIVMIVAAYFFILERDEIIVWTKKVAPQAIQKRMELVVYNLKHAIGGYFIAQFKIMGIVFVILAVCFGALGIRYGILLALLVSMLDFLPFFGTGTVMIPWALFKLLIGEYKMALIFIVIYIATQTIRQLIQPKLVADSIGLNPLVTLVLLYVGYRVSGVLGMIVAIPIGMITINLIKAGAFDYIINDVKILLQGIMNLRE